MSVHVQTGNMLDVIVEGKSLGLKQRGKDEVIWLPDPEGLLAVLSAEIRRLAPAQPAVPDGKANKVRGLPQRVHTALHTLWTKAVDTEGYVKSEWRELDDALQEWRHSAATPVATPEGKTGCDGSAMDAIAAGYYLTDEYYPTDEYAAAVDDDDD